MSDLDVGYGIWSVGALLKTSYKIRSWKQNVSSFSIIKTYPPTNQKFKKSKIPNQRSDIRDLRSAICLVSQPHFFSFQRSRYSFCDPFSGFVAFEEVVEELLFTDLDVFSVFAFNQVMRLIVVVQHPYFFA